MDSPQSTAAKVTSLAPKAPATSPKSKVLHTECIELAKQIISNFKRSGNASAERGMNKRYHTRQTSEDTAASDFADCTSHRFNVIIIMRFNMWKLYNNNIISLSRKSQAKKAELIKPESAPKYFSAVITFSIDTAAAKSQVSLKDSVGE